MKHAKSASDASRIYSEDRTERQKYIKMIGCDIIVNFMLKMVVRGITLAPNLTSHQNHFVIWDNRKGGTSKPTR
jgi:hypothetical protein